MKLVSLSEFQRISSLTDSVLSYLLKANLLKVEVDAKQGILVDIDSASNEAIITAIRQKEADLLKVNNSLLGDRLSTLIGGHLDIILERALAILKS